ncbi:hypothetical protein CAPTEDRAFT_167689 [Capitella teleta]|uniref:Peroxisomal membrane protein 2 n=1 Tax=Capitella teleta TaxID=283909 RepID=R7UCJ9_CAPTE|nr:hypothetical protein CAPTEDRAFT_167689 [Capitella teleta]|eukprot:ELU04105.1 hypothetical protein CAPTEDRAFT_167689 [Capitella teleta]
MSLSKPDRDSFLQKLSKAYVGLLNEHPLLVKACTSGITGALGNALSQVIVSTGEPFNVKRVAAFAIAGFCYIGPVMHYVYLLLEKLFPRSQRYSMIKRLLTERLIVTPVFLLGYLYILALMQLRDPKIAALQVYITYMQILKTNWRVWTVFQLINVNYVPQQYRTLFGNFIGLGWGMYMATKTRMASSDD